MNHAGQNYRDLLILDDWLKILHHHDTPQAKAPDSEILTLALLACQEFGGNRRKALQ